jgi:O-antigen ligase
VAFLGVALLVRVLTDDLSSPDGRYSGSINLSGGIAALLILVAIGLIVRRSRGVRPTVVCLLWLTAWTAIAVGTRGASAATVREGVREASVLALAVIVYNARGAVTPSIATRLVQFLALAPAVLALYQAVTHTGMDVTGELRSNGTFFHPASAAIFFAIAAAASLWRYLANRGRLDASLFALFTAALITTVSIDGLITLVAMIVALGVLRPGTPRVKIGTCAIALAVVLAFFATPLGAQRIFAESATNVASAESGPGNTSLAWRLHKWKILLPEWERSPLFGHGLGTTLTTRATPGDYYSGKPPHNEYIRYLVETGVIGLMTLLFGLGILIRRLLDRGGISRTLREGTVNAPTLGLVVILGCMVNALADNTFINSPTCYAATLIVVSVLSLPSRDTPNAPTRATYEPMSKDRPPLSLVP